MEGSSAHVASSHRGVDAGYAHGHSQLQESTSSTHAVSSESLMVNDDIRDEEMVSKHTKQKVAQTSEGAPDDEHEGEAASAPSAPGLPSSHPPGVQDTIAKAFIHRTDVATDTGEVVPQSPRHQICSSQAMTPAVSSPVAQRHDSVMVAEPEGSMPKVKRGNWLDIM